MTNNYSARVQRGAAVLDSVFPNGWRQKVDAYRLDMQDDNLDIVAQVTGKDYHTGLWEIQQQTSEPVWEQSKAFGFSDIGENPDYASLKAAWVAETKK